MRWLLGLISTVMLVCAAGIVAAQPPPGPGFGANPAAAPGGGLVARMMEYDQDKDGKLTKSEVTDARLERLFARSDKNGDGIVTREELASLEAKEESARRGRFGGGFGPPGGGPGGFMMMMARPGEILSPPLQDRLKLSAEQKAELATIQKSVDEKLKGILSTDQTKALTEMRQRGPGGFGPPGGGPPGGGPRGGFGPLPGPR